MEAKCPIGIAREVTMGHITNRWIKYQDKVILIWCYTSYLSLYFHFLYIQLIINL